MKADDVLSLVQLYRHDVLNQLQVLAGYIQLNDTNKTEIQMKNIFAHFEEQRKLFRLNIPQVSLWLLFFTQHYKNFRLSYEIDIVDKDLSQQDDYLLDKLDEVVTFIEKWNTSDDVLEIEFEIRDAVDYAIIELCINENNFKNIVETIKNNPINEGEVFVQDEIVIFRFRLFYT